MSIQEKPEIQHVFIVMRFDVDMAAEFGMDPEHVAVKKVVRSEEIANREVDRLNQLNGNKGSVYFWRSARLDRDLRLGDDPILIELESSREIPAEQQA